MRKLRVVNEQDAQSTLQVASLDGSIRRGRLEEWAPPHFQETPDARPDRRAHLGRGIADVDLSAGDVEGPPIKGK